MTDTAPDPLFAQLRAAHDALPDGHPNKFTSADVAACGNLAVGWRDQDDFKHLRVVAHKIAQILGPAYPEAPRAEL